MPMTDIQTLDNTDITVVAENTGLREGLYLNTKLNTTYLLFEVEYPGKNNMWAAYDIGRNGKYNTHISDAKEWVESIEDGELVPAISQTDSEELIEKIGTEIRESLSEKL